MAKVLDRMIYSYLKLLITQGMCFKPTERLMEPNNSATLFCQKREMLEKLDNIGLYAFNALSFQYCVLNI